MTAAHSPSAFTLLSILCLHVPGCARLTLYEWVNSSSHPAMEPIRTDHLYFQRKKVTQPDCGIHDSKAAMVTIVLQLSVSLFCFGLKIATLQSD